MKKSIVSILPIFLLLTFAHTQLLAQVGLVDLQMWKDRLQMSKNDSLRSLCFVHIGQFYPTIPDSAYYFFERAKETAKTVKSPFLDLYIDAYIAQYELELKPYKSLKTYLHAEQVMHKMEDATEKFKFYIYKHISYCYDALKRKKDAQKYAKKMLSVSHTDLDSLEANIHIFEMADTSDYPQYMEYFYSGMKGVKPLNRPDVEAQLLCLAGNLLYKNNKLKEAETFIKQAIQISEAIQDSFYALSNKGLLGAIYTRDKQYDKAIPLIFEAIKYNKMASKNSYQENLMDLSTCYAGLKNYEKAYYFQEEAIAIDKELKDIENRKMIGELEAQYELNDKREQLAAQELANKLKEERLRIEQQQKYLLLVLFIISLGLFVWALSSYRSQRRLTIDLRKEKQKVEEQATALNKVNLMKDKLFAMIGHDLRSPINSLAMLVGEWKENGFNTTNSHQYINKIYNKLENVQLIMNNLLEWATLHIKETQPIIQPLNIEFFIKNMLRQFDNNFEEKSLVVLNKVDSVDILADESQLQIIIRNILSNAIKYSHQGGYISINTSRIEDSVCLSIRDTGVGISEEKQQSIFDYPIPTVGTKGEKGTGIGLSLCKELVIKNNGHITLKSSIDKGTQINIILPISEKAPPSVVGGF